MKRAHLASLILWSIAGLCLVLSLYLGSWWSDHGLRIGLTSDTSCGELGCVTHKFDGEHLIGPVVTEARRAQVEMFIFAGLATCLTSMAVVASLVASALMLLRRKQLGYVIVPVTTLFLLVVAIMFVMLAKRGIGISRGLSLGPSLYLTFASSGLALLGSFTRLVWPVPSEPVVAPHPGMVWRPAQPQVAIMPQRVIAPPLGPTGKLAPLGRVRPATVPPIGPWNYASPPQSTSRYAPPGLVTSQPEGGLVPAPTSSTPYPATGDSAAHTHAIADLAAHPHARYAPPGMRLTPLGAGSMALAAPAPAALAPASAPESALAPAAVSSPAIAPAAERSPFAPPRTDEIPPGTAADEPNAVGPSELPD